MNAPSFCVDTNSPLFIEDTYTQIQQQMAVNLCKSTLCMPCFSNGEVRANIFAFLLSSFLNSMYNITVDMVIYST